jgi:hypothetical protein
MRCGNVGAMLQKILFSQIYQQKTGKLIQDLLPDYQMHIQI